MFTVIGKAAFLSAPLPGGWAIIGLFMIIIGILLHSYRMKKYMNSQQHRCLLQKRKNHHYHVRGEGNGC
ncbi:hypothetical protein HT574_14825 [Parageobacillus sp. VR-IP]|uniref:hypothetical protein n=1 Tax=Parageobacillus sp. VR-IP TaxID=2742205 RepID=UPI0015843B4E|nr:hypothetical protein [Parageobacillus sp. VR-IP]NUK31322.1 hypothetical protein [Parageobacillus sp. VR-IP]